MVQNVLTGKKYCPLTTLPKWGSKILAGTWHFLGLPPQRAVPLIRPVLITPQWTPVFKWVIAPHLGEIWVFENLEIFGWVHGPRHLAVRVYNAHWQSFIRMGAYK